VGEEWAMHRNAATGCWNKESSAMEQISVASAAEVWDMREESRRAARIARLRTLAAFSLAVAVVSAMWPEEKPRLPASRTAVGKRYLQGRFTHVQ
jgi:amino acid permease